MKISFVLPHRGRSGGIRSTVCSANGLIDKGHEVRLLVYEEKFSTKKLKPIIRNAWFRLRYPEGIDWLDQFKGQIVSFKDIQQCTFDKNEIVAATGIWACREIHKLNANGIFKVHNIRGQIPWERELMREAWSEDIPKIAVATYLKRTVREICSQEVSAVIPNGIDTTEYYPSVPESQRDGIGTIFHLSPHKDPETVMTVLKRLRKNCHNVPQRVFGVSRKPKELAHSMYFRFPTVDMARDIYSRTLVWIMASRSEGFPNPVLEAMACGCAVVATDCGGTQDIITNGENGFLVEVGSVDEIVDKVNLLLNDPTLRQRIVSNARETANKFTWQKSIDRLEDVLKTIVSR